MEKVKRERQTNFTSDEEVLLIKLVLENGKIIENKQTDSEVWKTKSETWNKIDELMSVSNGKYIGDTERN